MKRLRYAALVLGVLSAACVAAATGGPGLHHRLQVMPRPMPSPGSVTVAEGADFGKPWKITASWDQNNGWCVQLVGDVGGWGACSVSSWRDGDGLWLPDAHVRTDQVVVGAVPSTADKVILRLEDGRQLHARIYAVPQLPAPFVVYKFAVPHVVPGVLVVLGSERQEITRAGFAPP